MQSLPNSLRVDPQVWNFMKECNSGYNVQLSIRREHLWFGRNLCRKKCRKTARTPRLPRAITFPTELRLAQTWYLWKVDFSSFPMVSRITQFGQQKAPKSYLGKLGKKLYKHSDQGRLAGGDTWQIRTPRVTQHVPVWDLAINKTPLPLISTSLARVPRQKLSDFGQKLGNEALSLGLD